MGEEDTVETVGYHVSDEYLEVKIERAIIKLESIRILISCMLLTQLHGIVCLATQYSWSLITQRVLCAN